MWRCSERSQTQLNLSLKSHERFFCHSKMWRSVLHSSACYGESTSMGNSSTSRNFAQIKLVIENTKLLQWKLIPKNSPMLQNNILHHNYYTELLRNVLMQKTWSLEFVWECNNHFKTNIIEYQKYWMFLFFYLTL